MINHALALLTNLAGPTVSSGTWPGEAYLPTFKPLKLTNSLNSVRQQLFGRTPDVPMLFFRARQLLSLLRSTSLWSYVLALDSRLTFDQPLPLISDASYEPTVTRTIGTENDILYITGAPAVPDATGISRYSIIVDSFPDGRVTMTSVQALNISSTDVPIDQQFLTPFWYLPEGFMPESPSTIQVLAVEGLTFEVSASSQQAQWLVELLLRPQWDLSQLAINVGRLSQATLLDVLGFETEEPFATGRRLWELHTQLPLKLAGFVLSYLYRLEQLRQQGGSA